MFIIKRKQSMPYKFCPTCNKRISNVLEYCSTECKISYEQTSDSFCLYCQTNIGKQLKNPKMFCNLKCSNLYQKEKNKVIRICVNCKNEYTVQKSSKKQKTCSEKCRWEWTASEERNDKRMKTLIQNNNQKYGVDYWFQTKEGRKNPFENKSDEEIENIVAKAHRTKIEKYGTLDFSNKIKKTKLERYGTLNFNDKAKVTKIKKYGTLDFSEKARKTTMERYGKLSFTEKTKRTIQDRYGDLSDHLLKKSYTRLQKKLQSVVKFNFSVDEYESAVGYKKYSFQCMQCSTNFEDYLTNGNVPVCTKCHPRPVSSRFQQEMFDWLISTGIKVEQNNRTVIHPREIDLWLPEYKLGIECNGVYWHSEGNGKDRSYHKNKTDMVKNIGGDLIHVFEDEWYDKKSIVKSLILHRLNKNVETPKVYARKTKIVSVNSVEHSSFMKQFHIHGNALSGIRYGLVYDGILVAVMSFGKRHLGRDSNKDGTYELIRYATDCRYNVIGGASKLFSHFIKTHNPQRVITFSDIRLFTGELYGHLGFEFVETTMPNYWYICNSKRINRLNFQKHKIRKNFPDSYREELTEFENMRLLGYNRIWDCGHKKYVWKNN